MFQGASCHSNGEDKLNNGKEATWLKCKEWEVLDRHIAEWELCGGCWNLGWYQRQQKLINRRPSRERS